MTTYPQSVIVASSTSRPTPKASFWRSQNFGSLLSNHDDPGKGGYTYILASKGRRLYTGVTAQLRLRVRQHKSKSDCTCFTARYNIDRLVYYEAFETITEAIAREAESRTWAEPRKFN